MRIFILNIAIVLLGFNSFGQALKDDGPSDILLSHHNSGIVHSVGLTKGIIKEGYHSNNLVGVDYKLSYHFNYNVRLGIGSALRYFNFVGYTAGNNDIIDELTFSGYPVYVHGRWNIFPTSFSFFVDGKVGYPFGNNSNQGVYHTGLGAGFLFVMSKRCVLTLSCIYERSMFDGKTTSLSGTYPSYVITVDGKSEMQHIVISAIFEFPNTVK